MKKILILGGAYAQLPAVRHAKEDGLFVITCDYKPDNPGHRFSDLYENISTVDKEKVLAFAKNNNIDGIIAYASDVSAPTAAFVAEQLDIPSSGYSATSMMCQKDLFRKYQKEHGFLVPWFFSVKNKQDIESIKNEIRYPCIVKPVDSSGSKGVAVVNSYNELITQFDSAISFSISKRVIIEGIISTPYDQIHGEGIVKDGELVFVALGDQRFKNNVPIGTSLPSTVDENIMKKVINEVKSFISQSGMKFGGVNIEVRVTDEGDVYIIEIGPRTGGNYMPQLVECSTGIKEMEIVLDMSMGQTVEIEQKYHMKPCFQYIVGSDCNGKFDEVYIEPKLREKVIQKYIHVSKGDMVYDYKNSSGVVGVIIFEFNSMEEMEETIRNIKKYVIVKVEDN